MSLASPRIAPLSRTRRRGIDTSGDMLLRSGWPIMESAIRPHRPSGSQRGLGYREIATVLEDSIRYGRYKVGDRLPTEEALAVEFAVTRLTVRRALDLLTAADLLDRKPRRGTIVTRTPALAVTLSSLSRYTSLAESIRTSFLGRAEARADAALARLFDVAPDSRIVELHFARWRGALPIAFVQMLVPDWAALHVPANAIEDARQVNRSLADAGLDLAKLHQAIGAQNADPELAQRLGVAPGAAVLRITRDKATARQQVFQRIVSYFRADLYEYDTDFIDDEDRAELGAP